MLPADLVGDNLDHPHQLFEDPRRIASEADKVGDMPPWYHHDVDRPLGLRVMEGEYVRVLVYYLESNRAWNRHVAVKVGTFVIQTHNRDTPTWCVYRYPTMCLKFVSPVRL